VPRRFSFDEYWHLFKLGMFDEQRTELIDGEIMVMAAQENPHAISLAKTISLLQGAFGSAFWARNQTTLRVSDRHAPDPDIAIVEGTMEDWLGQPLPNTALLVVEVSDTTLRRDVQIKSRIYALAKVRDYWVLDIVGRRLEVFREPKPDKTSETGWSYSVTRALDESKVIAPLALPKSSLKVLDMLPRGVVPRPRSTR
jgi:Uma2 family endonuclease